MLSHQDARRTYDRIGSLQDSQAFYDWSPTFREENFSTTSSISSRRRISER